MTRNRYKIFETDYPYHVTCTVVDWLPLLEAYCIKQVIIDSMKYLQKEKGVKIFAYVIMHNHIIKQSGKACRTIQIIHSPENH